MNRVTLIGNLGNKPEKRKTNSGDDVANASMYTDEFYTDRGGNQQKRTVRHRLTMWGNQAINAAKHCSKGQQVFVEGRIQYNDWTDKEGVKHSDAEVVVTYIRWFPIGARPAVDAAASLRQERMSDEAPIDGASVALSEAEQRELDAEAAAFAAQAALDASQGPV